MLVEINSLDNGSGSNSNLDVYLSYNQQQRLFELRPFCRIDEDDFFDLLTESQIIQAQNGKTHFNVSKSNLIDKANIVY